jgi:hypothetical protein
MDHETALQTANRWLYKIGRHIVAALTSGQPVRITLNIRAGDKLRIKIERSEEIE